MHEIVRIEHKNLHIETPGVHSETEMYTVHTLLSYTRMSIQPAEKAVIEHLINSYD